jgi:periplasmic divalent cation tolerance protein
MTSARSQEDAQFIAQALVERHLAACVNVVPGVVSTYRWKGQVETEPEWLLVVKTRVDRFEEVRLAIRELHSYELPEIVMIEMRDADPAYLAWIDESLAGKP